MAQKSHKTEIYVILFAIVVIASSVFATLYVAGVIFSDGRGQDEGYQNVTFTDAVLACENRTKRSYGKKIRNLATDNHSSRFSEESYQYLIFIKADLYTGKGSEAVPYYVNCFVRAKNGSIVKYSANKLEEGEGPAGVTIDDGTNRFGIKRRD